MITTQKMYDLSFLQQMNDKNFIKEVILLYLKDTEIDLEEMNCAFLTGDYESVSRTAHKLKSSTGMLQANALYTIFEQTEKNAKPGGCIDLVAKLVPAAKVEFNNLKYGLKQELRQIETTKNLPLN